MTSTPSLPKLDKVNIQQNFQICSERKKADSWRFELQCQVKNLHSWTNSNPAIRKNSDVKYKTHTKYDRRAVYPYCTFFLVKRKERKEKEEEKNVLGAILVILIISNLQDVLFVSRPLTVTLGSLPL